MRCQVEGEADMEWLRHMLGAVGSFVTHTAIPFILWLLAWAAGIIVVLALIAALVFGAFVVLRRLWREWSAIGGYVLRQSALTAWLRAKEQMESNARQREWNAIARLSDETFAAIITRMRERAEMQSRLADILLHEAGRANETRAAFLAERAATRRHKAEALNTEADRLETLRKEIVEAKQTREQTDRKSRLRDLITGLGSNVDALAVTALAELNAMGSGIEWELLIPTNLPELVRARLAKILRHMAQTSSLGEARNARAQAEHILKTHDLSWERLVA
ncbi:MAG: hypothetical protein JO255_21615 [Alphaproteobacteria bacterium]|nr:hypothetical protein [Alphaproteobacteria bacterium]